MSISLPNPTFIVFTKSRVTISTEPIISIFLSILLADNHFPIVIFPALPALQILILVKLFRAIVGIALVTMVESFFGVEVFETYLAVEYFCLGFE